VKYQLVSLKNGKEKSLSEFEFNKFMQEKDIKTFYKHKTKNNHLVYKNDDWMIFSEN